MADYRVNLDIFAGPLDLLLYLVRRDEVDIYDIPISKITEEYIRYVEMLKSIDIDVASDFVVMAATLMQIKSAMLLPKADLDQPETDELTDPRAELIRQLLEYKRFKDAANLLNAAADYAGNRFGRSASVVEQLKKACDLPSQPGGQQGDEAPHIDLEQVTVWNLLEAFDSIMKATGAHYDISHITDDTPIDLYQIEILHRLQTEGAMSFDRVFEGRTSRAVIVGLFLATLELVREKLVWAEQPRNSLQLYLRALTDERAEQAVKNAILAVAAEAKASPAQDESEKQKQAPIAITELSSKSIPAGLVQKQPMAKSIENDKQ